MTWDTTSHDHIFALEFGKNDDIGKIGNLKKWIIHFILVGFVMNAGDILIFVMIVYIVVLLWFRKNMNACWKKILIYFFNFKNIGLVD